MSNSFRTQALVLRRTNYQEADRILDLLTPTGKISVLAKSVRKEKSKLAGGIEFFCLSDITFSQGRGSMYTLTSAKMLHFYSFILKDLKKLNFASLVLQKISRSATHIDHPANFNTLKTVFCHLEKNTPLLLLETWFYFQLAQLQGEQINLSTDTYGEKLISTKTYTWQPIESVFVPSPNGDITANHIKLLRLLQSPNLDLVTKITFPDTLLPPILAIAQSLV